MVLAREDLHCLVEMLRRVWSLHQQLPNLWTQLSSPQMTRAQAAPDVGEKSSMLSKSSAVLRPTTRNASAATSARDLWTACWRAMLLTRRFTVVVVTAKSLVLR